MSGENLVLLKKGSKRDKSIYFIHEGMGEIYTYIKLCESLDYDCWGVPYFMDNSEPTQYYDLDKLVEIYADEIAAHKTNAIISGYSAGGLLAFETARLLEKRGEAVLGAFILDYVPFQMLAEAGEGGEREEKSEPSEEQRNQRLLAVSQKMRKLRNRDSLYEAYQMFTDITDEGLEALFSDILDPEVLKAIPPYHRENLNDYISIIYRMNVITTALHNFHQAAPNNEKTNVKVSYIKTTMAGSRGNVQYSMDPFCNHPVEYNLIDCNHMDILKEPNVSRVAEAMNSFLASFELSRI